MAASPGSPASPGAATVHLWANPGPLECGSICHHDRQLGTAGRFSVHQLKKLLVYARSKGKHAYPWLSYSVWSHIAKNKLHLSEELAWLYFETFDVISDISPSERLKLLDMMNKCSSKEELDHLRKRVSVDTLKFLLFLFVQNAPRISLKAAMISGDEWPSPESDRRHKSPEYAHLTFLKGHLSDLLQLVAETDAAPGEQVVGVEGAKALEFLVSASPDKKRVCPLTELAAQPSEAAASGFSKVSQTFALPSLESWLRVGLSLSPFGPQALKGGARDKKTPAFRSESIGRLVSNSLTAPESCRCTLLHKINKQTLAKGDEGLAGSHMYIQNCRESIMYLLAPLKAVQVEKCSHCQLVLGAVETAVTVSNCDSVVIITACRRLHVSSSSLCTFHLLTSTRPVIFPPSHDLTFAPYNTHYPSLEKHMDQCGLRHSINCWDKPLCLGTVEAESDVWRVMSPDVFRPIAIPFKLEGETQGNPSPLPKAYQDELAKRKERTREWYEVLREADLSEEQAKQLQTNVEARFQEWLVATGYKKEIVDLELTKKRES